MENEPMAVEASDQKQHGAASVPAVDAADHLRGVGRIAVGEAVCDAIARITTIVQSVLSADVAIVNRQICLSLAARIGRQELDVDARRVSGLIRELVDDVIRTLQICKRIGVRGDVGATCYSAHDTSQ
ncbi:hypothetical protein WL18_15760 [Burkholderia ubonensis]|nr:hypothetical protein WL18_15760 [Burkholderia ubonensis]KWF08636.1 hypothetical protein WL83_23435 [Burkholderia ubonensis]